jgi:hypothetical protein
LLCLPIGRRRCASPPPSPMRGSRPSPPAPVSTPIPLITINVLKSRASESVLRSLGPRLKTEAPASNLVALHKSPCLVKHIPLYHPSDSCMLIPLLIITLYSDEVRHYFHMITEICWNKRILFIYLFIYVPLPAGPILLSAYSVPLSASVQLLVDPVPLAACCPAPLSAGPVHQHVYLALLPAVLFHRWLLLCHRILVLFHFNFLGSTASWACAHCLLVMFNCQQVLFHFQPVLFHCQLDSFHCMLVLNHCMLVLFNCLRVLSLPAGSVQLPAGPVPAPTGPVLLLAGLFLWLLVLFSCLQILHQWLLLFHC